MKSKIEIPDDYYDKQNKVDTSNLQFLQQLVSKFKPRDSESVKESFQYHLKNTLGLNYSDGDEIDNFTAYLMTSYSIRDRLVQYFNVTMNYFIASKAKQLCYVSSEFLLGRFLQNVLLNLQLEDVYCESLLKFNINLDDIFEEEYDQGQGSSGTGRFTACMLDSLATLNYPAWGYGIFFSKGYFKQSFSKTGEQKEDDEDFQKYIKPWYIKRPSICYYVNFGGKFEGNQWNSDSTIKAVANDFFIPGYNTINTIALRLWSTEEVFRSNYGGDDAANITSNSFSKDTIDDFQLANKLKQEYVLSSATVQDVLRILKEEQKCNIRDLPKFWSIHLNNTEASLMPIELLRILIDKEGLSIDESLNIVNETFTFTCQSIIEMTFERWPVQLFEVLLPRHFLLICDVNSRDLGMVTNCYFRLPMSIFEEPNDQNGGKKYLRINNLAMFCAHKVNGVSETHTNIIKDCFFKGFNETFPDRIINITSGISVRRWLHHCNRPLSELVSETVGGDYNWPRFNSCPSDKIHKPDIENNNCKNGYSIELKEDGKELNNTMKKLREGIHKDIDSFGEKFSDIKYQNKVRLAMLVNSLCKVELDPDFQLFYVMAKDFGLHHRQSLHIFSIIYRYIDIMRNLDNPNATFQPRAYIIAGKASPESSFQKKLVKLINNVQRVINKEERLHNLLRVAFVPNYNVSIAEVLVAGADVNLQLSTPLNEAAATSNFKFAINGSLIVGTRDGTNLEISKEVGENNLFFFGAQAHELDEKRRWFNSGNLNPKLREAFKMIRSGKFGDSSDYEELINKVEHEDYFLVNNDFEDYLEHLVHCDLTFENLPARLEKEIPPLENMEKFSSDRAVVEYALKIWDIKQYPVPVFYSNDDNDIFGDSGTDSNNASDQTDDDSD